MKYAEQLIIIMQQYRNSNRKGERSYIMQIKIGCKYLELHMKRIHMFMSIAYLKNIN